MFDFQARRVLKRIRICFQNNPYLICAIPDRAVARYYELIDTRTARANGAYAGGVAASTVAMEFGISTVELWDWISEHAEITASRG